MYSRKFSEQGPLPAGYSGVALRGEGALRREPETADPQKGRQTDAEKTYASLDNQNRSETEAFFKQQEPCHPRRPLYERGRPRKREEQRGEKPPFARRPTRPKDGEKEEKGGGLISSLFSLSGRSFSMEDIVLAGLILLLLSDKDADSGADGELLLILGLLLMSGR